MTGQGRRIVAALAVSLSLLAAFSAPPVEARPTSAIGTAPVLGGAIVDVRVVGGRVYVAYGNRVAVYSEDLTALVAEITLADYPTQLAVDGVTLAVLLAGGGIQLVALRDLTTTRVPEVLRTTSEEVRWIELSAGLLAGSSVEGEVTFWNVSAIRNPIRLGATRVDTVVDGKWWVMDLAAHGESFYAVLYDYEAPGNQSVVVAIGRGVDGVWTASRLGGLAGRQARQIEADHTTVAVLTSNAIVLFDPTAPSSPPTSLEIGAESEPLSMALTDGRLVALERDNGSSEHPNGTVVTYVYGRGDGPPQRTAVPLTSDTREKWRLRASDSNVYTFGRDELVAYDVRSNALVAERTRTLVTAEVNSALPLDDDLLLAARLYGGVCALDRTSGRSTWCAETGLTYQELFRLDPWLVGAAHGGLFTARTDRDGLDIVSQIGVDLTRERLRDAVPSGEALLAVMDTNAPRAPKTNYRIDEFAIRSDGSLAIDRATDIVTPPCGRNTVQLAVVGTWLGLTCDQQVIEFTLGIDGPVRAGQTDLPSAALVIAADDAGTVAVGLANGFLAYDIATGEHLVPAPVGSGADVPVESILWHAGCILTVHATGRDARSVRRHCPMRGGGFSDRHIYGFVHPRHPHIEPTRLEATVEGVLFVTGIGTVVQLSLAQEGHLAFLPFAARIDQR